uniref:Uncharacterized protein n=1 Tax=Meloidogyne hapla TaxID=6305 RepID=A0A1I8BBQ4_MELHA
MYFKLILYVFFFISIFNNISTGKKCKCPKNETVSNISKIVHRRIRRGAGCSCFGGEEEGGGRKIPEGFNRRPGKEPVVEVLNKRALIICENFFYSPLEFYVI